MSFSSINWLGVVICVVVNMVIGSLWFNPKTFYPAWLKAIGKSEKDAMGGGLSPAVLWPLTILSAIVQAVFLALMVNAMGSMTAGGTTIASGALAGLILWFGFVASTSLTNKLFAGQLTAWMIEAGNHLVTFVLMGAILGYFH